MQNALRRREAGRIRLEGASVFGENSDLLEKHSRIIELRHKYVSHSDDNEFESVKVVEKDNLNELVLNLEYNFLFSFDSLYELRELIRFVELTVMDRKESHIASIMRSRKAY